MLTAPGRSILFLVSAAVVSGGLAYPHDARAADAEEAAIQRGLELRRQKKDREALEEFQKAYSIGKSARALAQKGLAEEALGRWVDAEEHIAQALSDTSQPWIRKNSLVLRGALDEVERHLGSLEIMGPDGAEVHANGQVLGTLPFSKPARVPIGTLNVEVRKKGFLPTTRPVSIAAGSLTRESVDLAAAPPQPPAVDPAPIQLAATPPARTAPVAGGRDEGPARPEDTGGHWRRGLAVGSAVGALLAAGGGAVALFIRSQKLDDINKYQCNLRGDTVNPPDQNDIPRCLDAANSYSTMGVATIVSFSVAGALAITSGVLFMTAPSRASAGGALACAPMAPLAGALCQMRF
jgi:hypothetical protein